MPVALHTHSWYSLLEGASSPEALLERAAACGYTALALTDINNLYGAVPFAKGAVQHGVRPLLGACLRQHPWRCVALIAEQAGYRNLCRVLSRLCLGNSLSGGFNPGEREMLTPRWQLNRGVHTSRSPGMKPSLNENTPSLPELLAENAAGLHVLVDDVVLAERLHEAFRSRLWLEVIRPGRRPQHERELLQYSRKRGLRLVASTAPHLATPEEYATFRVITAVRQLTLLDQLPDQLAITPEHHLVDLEMLRRRFHDLPEAVHNTDLLAEQLESDVLPHDRVLPRPRLPRHLDAVRYLRLLCERGLRRRDRDGDRAAQQRLREELEVIEAADLTGYFLIVRDIARHARNRGHTMPLRGSAGNSFVCYLLEITDIDPLSFDLPMERFLHPGRADLPDIDLDFDWKVRDEVIAHVVRRYGPAHTAQISTHQFLQPRSAFREAAKVHGLSDGQISLLLEIADCGLRIGKTNPQSAIGGRGRPAAARRHAGRQSAGIAGHAAWRSGTGVGGGIRDPRAG